MFSLSGPYLHVQNRRTNQMVAQRANIFYLICCEGKTINSLDIKTLHPPGY